MAHGQVTPAVNTSAVTHNIFISVSVIIKSELDKKFRY